MQQRISRRPRGLTLVEALIALVISALGLLAFAAVQSRLRLSSDVAKQRAEAVRIAQENMENLRAFGTLAADATIVNNLSYDSGVATGSAQIAADGTVSGTSGAGIRAKVAATSTLTNTAYTVTNSVTASAQAGMKDVRVTVAWTDRQGGAQQVALRSFIAGINPRLQAALSIPPNGSPIKDPLGRDLRVPIPAKDLGDGRSVFKPNASGTLAFVFNNDTGLVTEKCTSIATTVTTAQIDSSMLSTSGNCTTVNGFLLSGYVRFSYGNPTAATPNDATKPLSIRIDFNSTAPAANTVGAESLLNESAWPDATAPVELAGFTAPDCGTQQSKTVRFTTPVNYTQVNNGVTQTITSTEITVVVPESTAVTPAGIAPFVNLAASAVQSPVDLGERYVSYTCVVYPRSIGGVTAWTGRSLLVPSGWSIGTGSGKFKVCRYSSDYNLNGYVWQEADGNVTKIDNGEHPYAYLMATVGLNNQNFLVIDGNKNCPTDGDVEVDGTGSENYTSEITVLHQP